MPSLAIPFTRPILPVNGGGVVQLPRDTNSDTSDGYFQVEAVYSEVESGLPIDFSGTVDDFSAGYPSDTPDGFDVAVIDNLGFRGAMLGLTPDPPPIRLAVAQTAPALLPDYATVDPFSVSADFVVERWADYAGIELIDFDSAGFTSPRTPEAVSNFEVFSTPAQSIGAFELVTVGATFSGVVGWNHMREGIAEIATAKAGVAGTAGVHEIRYLGMVIRWEWATTDQEGPVDYRRIYPRDDGLAGGAARNYPPLKSVQSGNRTSAGYL